MKTKIILETGCNHQGSMAIVSEMIYLAAKLGVWGLKFQKRDIESMPDELKNKPRSQENSFGPTYYEHRKVLEFPAEQMAAIKKRTEDAGLVFLCSAFDEKSIDDLIGIGCQWIKLPSQLYTQDDLQRKLFEAQMRSNINTMVSTGMHDEEEIFSNPWIDRADVVLHCISAYPFGAPEAPFMGVIQRLKEKRGSLPVGYSSHDENGRMIYNAVIAGAEYVERHFTLDKHMKGSDHGTVSSDFDEMLEIINAVKMAEYVLGGPREIGPKEEEVKKIYRG